MQICPECKSASPPKARFCGKCGAPLNPSPAATPSTPADSPDVGRTDAGPGDTTPLPTLAATSAHAPPDEQAPPIEAPLSPPAAVGPPAPAELAPTAPLATLAPPEEIPLGIALNFSRVLVANHSSIFDVQVENRSALPIENIELRFESRGLPQPAACRLPRLAPLQTRKLQVEIEPARAGHFILQCGVLLDHAGQRKNLRGSHPFRVNEAPSAQNFHINIGHIEANRTGGVNIIQDGGKVSDIGLEGLIPAGTIQTLNDLLNLVLPEKFEPLELDLDFEVTMSATIAPRAARPSVIPGSFLGGIQPGEVLRLVPETDGGGHRPPLPLLLVARPVFRIGRSRVESDWVAWFLPRNPANDERTMRLGKVQVVCEAAAGAVRMRDAGSANGAAFENLPLPASGGSPLDQRGTLLLAGDYELDVCPFKSTVNPERAISNLRSWHGPEPRTAPASGAVRFQPLNSLPAEHTAVWLFTDAAFGSSRANPVVLQDPGLDEIQGRFLHHRGCFWIENTSAEGVVALDDQPLRPSEVAPLVNGHRLRLGNGPARRVEIA